MSLFVGNLPPRIRADDLQRVFGRFGQCVLRLKGSFGFVVYEFPQDAEKALRALQGRYICGAPLTLMWSKKQPIPRQGRQRVVRSYALHGKDSARGRESACRRVSPNDWRGYRVDVMQLDTDGEKLNSDEGRGEPQKYRDRDFGEGLPVDGVTDAAELVDTDNQIDNVVDFDRYEPCRSHEGEDGHGNRQMAYSGCASVPQRPQEIARTVKISDTTLNCFNDLKSRNSCFSCGGLGHKKRDCPGKYSSRRNPTRFDHRKDDAFVKSSRGEAELERCRSVSWEKLWLNKDSASRRRKSERASDTGKSRMLLNNGRSSVTVTEETDGSEVQVCGGKKRSKWEGESPNRHRAKKARSLSSPPHSDYPASKSCAASKSSESVSRCSHSRARSKSVSIRAQSMPSDSRSSSKLTSSKSRSRSSSFTSSSESQSLSSYTAHVGNDASRVQNPGSHAAVCMSPEGSKEKFAPENSGGLMMGLTQLKKPASEKHVNYCNDRSTSISSEEMCMVLKHYGMELPAESERHLAIEEYLGSARLWPWEIIYYRRLKKGLVLVENYARRVSQNQEFGITDKYVRSSSGWGEIDQENP